MRSEPQATARFSRGIGIMVAAALVFVLAAGLLRSAVGSMSRRDAPTIASYSIVNAHSATLAVSEVYIVRAGDSLWSIVSNHFPDIDPRPLVDQMNAAIHGAVLQPGDRLELP